MSSDFQISRLNFAGTPAERFMPLHSRKSMLWAAALLAVVLIVTAILYAWTRDPFVLLILLVPLAVRIGALVAWPEPARFTASGDAVAMLAYLDRVMGDASGYQRSVAAAGEIAYRHAGKGWLAESRSHCVLAVRNGELEVSGSRDILRRLRYWLTQHFAHLNAPRTA